LNNLNDLNPAVLRMARHRRIEIMSKPIVAKTASAAPKRKGAEAIATVDP
jgi:hypothetical protein